jgi:hypothetical protein
MKRLLLEHLPLSLLIGILGWLSGGGLICVPLALVFGWCIDVDHLYDFGYYWFRNRKNTDWSLIRSGKYFSINAKIFVPLHSWELTLILIIGLDFLTQNLILGLTTGVSHMTHLIQDMRTYNVRFLGYSFISRSLHAFDQQSFCSS